MSHSANKSGIAPYNKPRWADIADSIRAYMTMPPSPTVRVLGEFVPGKTRIPLNIPSYGAEEVMEALDSLMSTWVTMGPKVKCFEEMFAKYIGVKHAVMTNSGSSANLLALSALNLQPGDEVITPAVTWATTVFPIAQLGAVPVLVDVNLDTYNIDHFAAERAVTSKTRAIMPVHLLGNPCDMACLSDLAQDAGLYLIEDACEAHGAEYTDWKAGKHQSWKVGSFGDIATFSFFFSHHISTIEGGMIVTDNDRIVDQCRSLRSFGWIRDHSEAEVIKEKYPTIDPRFLFQHAGYNFRPTEIQGAFGIHQLPRLEGFIEQRRENAAYWSKALADYEEYFMLPREELGTRHVSFAYAVQVRANASFTKRQLVGHLESRGLETRPIVAGNIVVQPAMQGINYHVSGTLTNSELIQENAFFFGNHHGIGPEEREAIVGYFREFFEGL